MNFKQLFGILLLIVMLVFSYALFGGVSHISKPVEKIQYNITANDTSPHISEYKYYTFEENAGMDVGMVSLMILLMGITSLGGVANANKKE